MILYDQKISWFLMAKANIYLAVERDDRLLGFVRLPLNMTSRFWKHPGALTCVS